MASEIQINPEPARRFETHQPDFNFSASPNIEILLKDTMAIQANKLAEHEGKISGLSAIVSALQSYKGFLQGIILALLALILAGFGLVINLQSSAATRIDKSVDGIAGRLSSLELRVDALPSRVSAELRETSRDLILITRSAADSPSTDSSQKPPPTRR